MISGGGNSISSGSSITEQVFVSTKSHEGCDIKALELPGLWNGSMAFWHTIFVEVPIETFTPVKTVEDLLRPDASAMKSRVKGTR